MVRIEGNEFESQGGPGIVANSIRALTLRSNYFEANNLKGNMTKLISFVDHHSGAQEPVCTDMLINGYPAWASDECPLLSRYDGKGDGAEGEIVLAPIPLGNIEPSAAVIVEGNYHNPGSSLCAGDTYHGAFAAGAVGMRAEASDCSGCSKHAADRKCLAVGTGNAPDANSSLAEMAIQFNTGDFSENAEPDA